MRSELESLNECWNRAWLEKDVVTVDRLMAEDYVYVAPNGVVLDRPAILGIIRSPSYLLHHGTRTEVVVRPISGEAAVIRHRWEGEGTFDGKAFKDDHRCVMVCCRQDGAWRIVMEQCSFNGK